MFCDCLTNYLWTMSLKIIVTLYYNVCVCGSTLLSLLLILNGILISITCGTVGSVNVSFSLVLQKLCVKVSGYLFYNVHCANSNQENLRNFPLNKK